MRVTASVKRRPPAVVSKGVPIPAPTGGWDAISPLAAMPADRAVQIENWVCRPGWIEPRRGYRVWATGLGSATEPVDTVMAYNGSTSGNKLFGVAGGTIYDCTSQGAAVATPITGQASSKFQYIQFSNPANQFLIAVNGFNDPVYYNGATWSTASITGTGVDQTTFSNINAHNGRLWFVQKNTTNPVYLTTVGAVTGPAAVFPLGDFMTRGGYIVAIGTWTVDTRQNVDEYIAFISSRGEVMVYAGTDPSTVDTWSLVGRYFLGRPLGDRCFARISGDLLLITVDGVVGMSEMLSTDRAAANRVSLTSTIMNAMADATATYASNFGWQIIEFPLGTLAIVNVPIRENIEAQQYVMNTITGAWSQFTGINANCWEVDSVDNIYFGGNDGTVYNWYVAASDNGADIVCTMQTAYNSFGNAPQRKRYTALQPLIFFDVPVVIPSFGIKVDFSSDFAYSTEEPAGTPNTSGTMAYWLGVAGSGHYVAIMTQITINDPDAIVVMRVNGWNMTAESGAFV